MAAILEEFLMIKLKSEVDKNRFCFLLEKVKMLSAFDTQHLFLDLWLVHSFKIFSFNSTWISTKAIKECAGDLKNKFYVDNLLLTSENSS